MPSATIDRPIVNSPYEEPARYWRYDRTTRLFNLRGDRRRDYGEDRHISIGRVEPGALIAVAHTERRGRIRLISARPASRKERRVYHERTLR